MPTTLGIRLPFQGLSWSTFFLHHSEGSNNHQNAQNKVDTPSCDEYQPKKIITYQHYPNRYEDYADSQLELACDRQPSRGCTHMIDSFLADYKAKEKMKADLVPLQDDPLLPIHT